MLLKLKIPKEDQTRHLNSIVLAGDIGATKSNLTIFHVEGEQVTALKEEKYSSQDYNSFTQIAGIFLEGCPLPQSVCLGVAGPVINNRVKLTNLSWSLDGLEMASQLGVQKVDLINDLEATAYGLAMLNKEDVLVIHKGSDQPVGNAAVIAPGTGLGEAGMFWDGKYFHPFATEGGHCDFAPRNDLDHELYNFLHKRFGHVSWERLVCGPGIVNIYHFLRDEMKMEEPAWLTNEFKKSDQAAIISQQAGQFEICKETMRLFIGYLAQESANLVLKLKASGGLFIGGGIAPQIISLLENEAFFDSFCQSGRMNYLLEKVPVKIILNVKTALLGAAYYGSKN